MIRATAQSLPLLRTLPPNDSSCHAILQATNSRKSPKRSPLISLPSSTSTAYPSANRIALYAGRRVQQRLEESWLQRNPAHLSPRAGVISASLRRQRPKPCVHQPYN